MGRQKHIARLTLDVEITSDEGFDLQELPMHIDGFNSVIELPMADVCVVAGNAIEVMEKMEE